MPVESRCRLILGVYHQGEGGACRGGTQEDAAPVITP